MILSEYLKPGGNYNKDWSMWLMEWENELFVTVGKNMFVYVISESVGLAMTVLCDIFWNYLELIIQQYPETRNSFHICFYSSDRILMPNSLLLV